MNDYLTKQITEKDIEELMDKIRDLGLNFDERVYTNEYWNQKLGIYNRSFDPWDEGIPKKKGQFMNKVAMICDNYLRFLYQSKKLSIHVANYFAGLMYDYYADFTSEKKLPGNLFQFTEEQIDRVVGKMSADFVGMNVVRAMSVLNSLVMFSEYLEVCGNYSEENKNEVINSCRALYQVVYDSNKNYQIETLAFERFPLF
jgi:hypothetical protein